MATLPAHEPATAASPTPLWRPTPRVVLLCLLLAAVFGVVNPHNDYRFGNTYIGACHLPPGAVAALVLLVAIQALLYLGGRLCKRFALSRNELLTVYISCLFSALVPGRAAENFFVPCLLGPFYYATSENKWLEFLQPHLNPWFTPALNADGSLNQKLVADWYQGLPPGELIPWTAWLLPIAAWSILIFALYGMLACLSVLLRAQWVEHEALAFPLLKLPMDLTEGADQKQFAPLLRTSAFWMGLSLAILARSMASLNRFYPEIPNFPLSLPTGPLLTEAPWNQVGQIPVLIIPLAVGVTYLLSTEVAFSFWFFFLLHKFELIIAYYLGFPSAALPDPAWTRGWAKNFISYQNIGAYFAFAALLFWTGRSHFRHIWQRALGRQPRTAWEEEQRLTYPVAFWGFLGCSLFLVGWSIAAGLRPEIAVIFWFTYIVMALGLARAVVEGGLLYVNHGWSPLGPLAQLFPSGSSFMNPATIVPGSIMQGALIVDMKGFLLPSFLHAFKLAHDRSIAIKPLLVLIFAVISIAFGLSVYTNVTLGYHYGGLQLHPWMARSGPQDTVLNASSLLRGHTENTLLNWFWLSLGSLQVLLLTYLRTHFSWFPLHPLGLIMWSPFVMQHLWFSIFLGWLIKSLILRFGGSSTFIKATPAFLGLALGDVIMMVLWAGLDAYSGRTGYTMMPG